MTPVLLAAEGLRKSYGGVEAVRDVSFTLGQGEVLALIGPNGAGKSTCFALLDGQVRPDAGVVRLKGRAVTGLPPRAMWARGVGRTFQVATAFASMTVRENVEVGLLARAGRLGRVLGAPRAQAAEAEALLALAGLADQADRPCAALAYGDLKRLDLAMALTGRPDLLLMDEPTAGMGVAERGAMMAGVTALAAERRIGVLFTEHDMDVVFAHADRVLVLDRGRLIADGPPAAVRADPRVRAVYLGGVP